MLPQYRNSIFPIDLKEKKLSGFGKTIVLTILSGGALLAQDTTVLFQSDGSSVTAFPCDYGQTTADAVVDPSDGTPAPSIVFDSPNLTKRRAAIYVLPGLGFGQTLHGSLDIKIESTTGYVNLALFGQPTNSSCVFPNPNAGSWPITSLGYRVSHQRVDWWTTNQSGVISVIPPDGSHQISGGTWHNVDYTISPVGDGTYQWDMKIDGSVFVAGISYEQIPANTEFGVEIGIGGSGEPTRVKYDNVRLEIISPKPVSCLGFDSPLASGPVTIRGNNRALPLKAQLVDKYGTPLTDLDLASAPVLQVLYDAGQGGEPVDVTDDALPAGSGTEGNQFFFEDLRWRYHLKTRDFSAPGTYHISIVSGDVDEYEISPGCKASFVVTE